MVNGLWRDLVLAARALAKARAFTFVCVVSLGIGMAPVIAIPYVSRLTTLAPPGVNTEELVELVTTSVGPHQQTEQWSYPDYLDLRDANTGITLIGWTGGQSEITFQPAGGTKMQASTMFVPANYFKTLGVALARGAGFDASADDQLNAEPVVVLNYQFWQNRLSADPDIVGKTLTMDGIPHVVVGVGAGSIWWSHRLCSGWDLFVPLERHPRLLARTGAVADENFRGDRAKEWLNIHGRLSPGVNVQQASAAVAAVTAQLAKAYPATNEFKAGIAAAYDPLGTLLRSNLWRLQARRLHAHRHGAAGRVPEYLRHDAGARRDARARAVDPPGDRRQPRTAGAVSVVRIDRAGVRGRCARLAGALQRVPRCCPGSPAIRYRLNYRRRCGSISPWSRPFSGSACSRAWYSDGCRRCASADP